MTIPAASYAKMRLGRLTDSHLQWGNPQCGFEFVKTPRWFRIDAKYARALSPR
jgi:hypothetical protein